MRLRWTTLRRPDGLVLLLAACRPGGIAAPRRAHRRQARAVGRGWEGGRVSDELGGPLYEDPPVGVYGSSWSRTCPHCEFRLLTLLGPTLPGRHLCRRDGVVHLIVWR